MVRHPTCCTDIGMKKPLGAGKAVGGDQKEPGREVQHVGHVRCGLFHSAAAQERTVGDLCSDKGLRSCNASTLIDPQATQLSAFNSPTLLGGGLPPSSPASYNSNPSSPYSAQISMGIFFQPCTCYLLKNPLSIPPASAVWLACYISPVEAGGVGFTPPPPPPPTFSRQGYRWLRRNSLRALQSQGHSLPMPSL